MANIRTVRRSGRVFRGGRMRRESLWAALGTVETTMAGAPTAVLILSLNATALALRPFTVVRTRGIMQVRSDQVAGIESYGVDFGLAVVSDQAVLVGVTAVPTPLTDKASDIWYVYEQMFATQTGNASTGNVQDVGTSKEFDSRAMRKVEEGSDIVGVVENELAGAIVVVSGRFLIKLH